MSEPKIRMVPRAIGGEIAQCTHCHAYWPSEHAPGCPNIGATVSNEHCVLESFCNEDKRVTLDDLDAIVRNFYRHPAYPVPVEKAPDAELDAAPMATTYATVTDVRRRGTELLVTVSCEVPAHMMLVAEVWCNPPADIGGEGMMLRRLVPMARPQKMEWDVD